MVTYKNLGVTTEKYHGVTFKPGETKSCKGYISDPNFVRITNPIKKPANPEPPKIQVKPEIKSDKQGGKPDGSNSNK